MHTSAFGVPLSPLTTLCKRHISMVPKGVVTVLDILRVHRPEREEVNVSDKIDGVVAHFIAHNKVRD